MDGIRFTSVDPMAEKYYSWSPYVYCANNPMKYIDPTGMDYYYFDLNNNGEYYKKEEREGKHRMVVKTVERDEEGNIKSENYKFYDFADPKNDPEKVDKGTIDKVEILSLEDVTSMINNQGGFNSDYGSYYSFYHNSKGKQRFDYVSEALPNYNLKKKLDAPSKYLYIAEGGSYAHNHYNFGNFLWGATGYALGFNYEVLSKGGHINSLINPRDNGYLPQLDSEDDQRSIRLGTLYARKNNYRNKVK